MGRRKDKPRIIPEQDKRICGSICICQLIVVVSCVAIVYLSVAIYMPSYKAFQAGFEDTTVMCQAVNTSMANCATNWASCGEWCLTKSSGLCPQIHATVRRNGTDVLFENCTRSIVSHCPQASTRDLKKYNCNNGTSAECTSLNGVFSCALGHCSNYSELFECHYKADGFSIDAEKDNMKLNGFFFCKNSNCTQIKKSFPCDRYCSKITTSLRNTFVMHNNSVTTLDCEGAYAHNEARGSEPGIRLETPVKIWNENQGNLLANCIDIQRIGDTNNFMAFDCLNGTLLENSTIPEPYTNFTTFWKIYDNSTALLDPTQKYLPWQSTLTIYNTTKLFINLEGCVNTLRGECKEFLFSHGQDGAKNTAQSRFQCFYNKHHSDFVVTRYDLAKTWRELMVAVFLPSTLFIISLTTLCIISQTVKVGDDAKMRCQYCMGEDSDGEEGNAEVGTSDPNQSVTVSVGNKSKGAVAKVKGDVNRPSSAERMNGLRSVGAKCAGTTSVGIEMDEGVGAIGGVAVDSDVGDESDGGAVDGGNRLQEISDLSTRADEHILIPLSPCTEVSQRDSEEGAAGVAESCLSTSASVEQAPELEDTVEAADDKPEVDPDPPLMIL